MSAVLLALHRALDEANGEFERGLPVIEAAYEDAKKLPMPWREAHEAVGIPALEEVSDKIVDRINVIERRIVAAPGPL